MTSCPTCGGPQCGMTGLIPFDPFPPLRVGPCNLPAGHAEARHHDHARGIRWLPTSDFTPFITTFTEETDPR